MSAISRYLEEPPYYGRSHVRDSVVVKKLCGPTAHFDKVRKVWSTRCEDSLRFLVASKKWHPIGFNENAYGPLMRAAQKRRATAEAKWVADAEAKAIVTKVAEETRRIKDARTASTLALKAKHRKAQTAQERKHSHAPPSTPIKKTGSEGVHPSAAEVAECKRLGFTVQGIAHSNCRDELGPRGSLSNEGRVLRWCSLFDHDDGVQQLDADTRTRSWGGIEMLYSLPERASRDYAVELNAMGKG